MSVIRKKPFIETLVESLSATDRALLLEVMNTPGDNENVSFDDLPDKGITPVYFQLDKQNFKTGILIYTDDNCVLIAHHRFQDLLILELNVANKTYEKINEFCDINELRRIVDVAIDSISSGDAEENTVLAADGEGGSNWVKSADTIKGADVPDGAVIKVLAIDETGKMVKADAPSGTVTIDGALSDESTNAVQNKVVKEALDDKADAEDVYTKTAVDETYAKQDGDYAVAGLRAKSAVTAETAEQLLATKSVVDKVPYLHRTSGGSADIGNRSSGSIVGGSIVVNQQFNPLNFESNKVSNGITWTTNPDGSVSAVGTITGLEYSSFNLVSTINVDGLANHKYYIKGCPIGGSNETYCIVGWLPNWSAFNEIGNGIIINKPTDLGGPIRLVVNGLGSTYDVTFNPKLIDLTQALGSTIADYIYSLETANAGAGIAWFNTHFPNYPLDYNAETLTHVEGLVSHDMIGFNQWDEEWELGGYDITTGAKISVGGIRNKNDMRLLPNTTYYFNDGNSDGNAWVLFLDINKNVIVPDIDEIGGIGVTQNAVMVDMHTFTTPKNCAYLRWYMSAEYGSTYNHDICINISWSGTKDGQYESYVKHSYPLDNAVILRGIPKLDVNNKLYYDGDIYSSDGKVARRYALVDMGTLSWNYNTTYQIFYAKMPNDQPNYLYKGLCSKYKYGAWTANKVWDNSAAIGAGNNVLIKDDAYTDATAFKTAMSGVYLLYELATPTEETFDQFIDPQIVNDWGTEEFVVETPLIPVGHDTAYPANLRDKLQNAPDLPSTTDDYIMHYEVDGRVATYVLLSTWLTANNYKVNVIPPAPATDGNYTLKVAVSDGEVVYTWESEE